MAKRKKVYILPAKSDRILTYAVIFLVIFGSLMIFSAEMGNALLATNIDNQKYITNVIFKQSIFVIIGMSAMIFMSRVPIIDLNRRILNILAIILAIILIMIRFIWGDVFGAYAWMKLGPITIQPSEFAKIFIIIYFAKEFSKTPKSPSLAKNRFEKMMMFAAAFVAIIIFWQNDFGSGLILFVISYMILLLPQHKGFTKYQRIMLALLFLGIIFAMLILSPMGTAFLESLNSSNYQINRFLASANPFKDQYNTGYHLVLSLVSFATGGIFGLGYGNSIHKYMNFPNPENDFILPVLVEETGIVGFSLLLILYLVILYRLFKHALNKDADIRNKIVLVGVALYFIMHFILNVGGVSGILPLTGVPLLLVSAGGSSWIATLAAIGLAQNEINRLNKRILEKNI